MRHLAIITLLLTAGALPACIELDGQRISIRYVAERDELQILLFYDGIHDSDSRTAGEGADQLPKFVRNGDILLLDWPVHFDRVRIAGELDNLEKRDPALAALGRAAVDSIRSVPLGHYRDEKGRIGAAQLLLVSSASVLASRVNALLNHAILNEEPEKEFVRTHARMREGAKKGEQWLRLDGHSILMSAPVHLREWVLAKGRFFEDILESAEDFDEEKEDEDGREKTAKLSILQALTLSPVSIVETPERVTIRLGTKSAPSTFRCRLRESKKTGLDELLLKLVPDRLDDRIANALLSGEPGKADPWIRAILAWGPPEERVRALLHRVVNGKTKEGRLAAAGKLAGFAESWNREQGYPEAPAPKKDGAVDVAAWKKWYGRVIRFPGG